MRSLSSILCVLSCSLALICQCTRRTHDNLLVRVACFGLLGLSMFLQFNSGGLRPTLNERRKMEHHSKYIALQSYNSCWRDLTYDPRRMLLVARAAC